MSSFKIREKIEIRAKMFNCKQILTFQMHKKNRAKTQKHKQT